MLINDMFHVTIQPIGHGFSFCNCSLTYWELDSCQLLSLGWGNPLIIDFNTGSALVSLD